MRQSDIEGVLGHEITHVANGDMVTMTLIQGVVNAFAMFLAEVAGHSRFPRVPPAMTIGAAIIS